MALLRPLLLDNVPSIQQSAALALGRLANYSDELAEAVVSNEILPQLVYSLSEQNVSHLFILDWNSYFGRLWKFKLLSAICLTFCPLSSALLQESRRIRAALGRQALTSPRQGRRALWRSRGPCQLPRGVRPLRQGGCRPCPLMRRQAQR